MESRNILLLCLVCVSAVACGARPSTLLAKMDACHYDEELKQYQLLRLPVESWMSGHSKHHEDCCFHSEGLLDGVCNDSRRCDAEDAPIHMTADSKTKTCTPWCAGKAAKEHVTFDCQETVAVGSACAGSCDSPYIAAGDIAPSATCQADGTFSIVGECVCPVGTGPFGGGCDVCVKVVAGGVGGTCAGDNCLISTPDILATAAIIAYPMDVSVDSAGNLYIADGNWISKVDTAGIIHRLGTKLSGPTPQPVRGVLGTDEAVYFTDVTSGSLHIYSTATNDVTHIGVLDSSALEVRTILGLSMHPTQSNTMYVLASKPSVAGIYSVDLSGSLPPTKVLAITAEDHTGLAEWADGIAQQFAFNGSAELFFTAYRNQTIYKWDDVAGHQPVGVTQPCEEFDPLTGVCVDVSVPENGELLSEVRFGAHGVAFDSKGNMLVTEGKGRVWMVDAITGKLTLVAGLMTGQGSIIVPGDATNSGFRFVRAAKFGPGEDSVYIADQNNHRIVRVLLKCTKDAAA